MEFLGFGLWEILLILLVLLIVVGPARLPEVAATIARYMRTIRLAIAELNQELRVMGDDVKQTGEDVKSSVNPDETDDMKETMQDVQKAARTVANPRGELMNEVKSMAREVREAFEGDDLTSDVRTIRKEFYPTKRDRQEPPDVTSQQDEPAKEEGDSDRN